MTEHTPGPQQRSSWNAGTGKGWTDKRGYRWIYVTENGRRRAKREHRHIMEQYLGRTLGPEELVHHKNGDRSDNRIENLAIEDWGAHTAAHHNGQQRPDLAKRTMEVLANYREENKRLRILKTELLEALDMIAKTADSAPETNITEEECITANWDVLGPAIRAAIAKAKGE